MGKFNSNHNPISPPPALLPILQKIKSAYSEWFGYYQTLPKLHRYSLGHRIDLIFIEIIEFVSGAVFLSPEEKLPYVRAAIRKTDTLKILLMILWENNSIRDKPYLSLSLKFNEIGKMLGGWSGQLKKKNSPDKEEK